MPNSALDELCINTLRFLSVDAVQQAKSGHPGAPMGAATIAYTLWHRFLRHNPHDPSWPNRDRFILSAGHASALLYSLLHLTGYDLSLEDLQDFRQWGSKTPGHPEHGLTPGIEVTTGPLGQGFANGIGMAIAEQTLASKYNQPSGTIVDHFTYAIVSDGDLQEGVSSEAASLAGTLKLGKLVYLYDDNGITIEGPTSLSFTESVSERFQAYGWQVIGPIDGMDIEAVDASIREARANTDMPSLVICRTTIGYGSPNKAGTAAAHGEPLGSEETSLTKANLGWPADSSFFVPEKAEVRFREAVSKGQSHQSKWETTMVKYRQAYPDMAADFLNDIEGILPLKWDSQLHSLFKNAGGPLSTREASGVVMNEIAKRTNSLIGGSADLAPSTKTIMTIPISSTRPQVDQNLHFGVREHAMGAIANGIAVHGGFVPYTATFLVFSDYMRPPIRLAALMNQRVIFVFSHDSIGLGEDGPTHQPIEHLAALRAVPNLTLIRPADASETAHAWRLALKRTNGPTALVLSRQNLPILHRLDTNSTKNASRGGYVLWESSKSPVVILLGTGSEVHIALEAGKKLAALSIPTRVVSLLSWEIFDEQSVRYRNSVLPPEVPTRVSIEAGATMGWERYTGTYGASIGLNRFGASAKGPELYRQFGITVGNVVSQVRKLLR